MSLEAINNHIKVLKFAFGCESDSVPCNLENEVKW